MMTAVIEIMMVQYKETFVIGFSKVITLVEFFDGTYVVKYLHIVI